MTLGMHVLRSSWADDGPLEALYKSHPYTQRMRTDGLSLLHSGRLGDAEGLRTFLAWHRGQYHSHRGVHTEQIGESAAPPAADPGLKSSGSSSGRGYSKATGRLISVLMHLPSSCVAYAATEKAVNPQMGRMPADGDAQLAQRLQEEFNSSSGARPKRSAASEAKKRLAEVLLPTAQLHLPLTPCNQAKA